MTTVKPTYCISPHKFTIYDSELSDESDTDLDSEEWISISTSLTAGSLPSHIKLRPRAHNIRPRMNVKQHQDGRLDTTSKFHMRPVITTEQLPIATLKTHLPELKAIYIVNPTSIYQTSRTYLTPVTCSLFSSLRQMNPSPVCVHAPSDKEYYLRICGNCAKSRIVLCCDQTWRVDDSVTCRQHARFITSNERHGSETVCKDREMFEILIQAVQPLQREAAGRANVKVFDMTNEDIGNAFEHKEGCGCSEKE